MMTNDHAPVETKPCAVVQSGVPFIGIVEPHNSRYDEVVRLLREHGAVAILPDINTLEQSLV